MTRTGYLAGLRLLGIATLLTVAYYLVPVHGRLSEVSWSVWFVVGVTVLSALMLVLIGRLLRAGPQVRLQRLFVVLLLTVFFFAEEYYLLSMMSGGEIADLHTKTDALYFTVSTLATVGFGDVHAAGQLARVAVTVQIVFDLIFLGTAVTVGSGILRAKAALLSPPPGDQADQTDDQADGEGRVNGAGMPLWCMYGLLWRPQRAQRHQYPALADLLRPRGRATFHRRRTQARPDVLLRGPGRADGRRRQRRCRRDLL
jgi:voltage-gated potassium channel